MNAFISHVGGKHTTDKRCVTSDGTLNSLPLVADIAALPHANFKI